MKMDNKGFSLVEIIIAVFVLTILLTWGFRNLGVLDSYDCRQCRTQLEAAMQSNKIDCLSKSKTNTNTITSADSYLEILYENNSVYAISHVQGVNKSKEEISKRMRTKIAYRKSGSGTDIELINGESIKIGYNRSTGAFLPLTSGGVGTNPVYISHLVIKTGKHKKVLRLETKTGKIVIE